MNQRNPSKPIDDGAFALELARRLHDDATFEHVNRVVARVALVAASHPDAVFANRAMIVAMLHDCVEDSPLSVDTVEALFSKEIAVAVDAVSRRKNQNESYDDYIDRAKRNPISRVVKLADVEDHLALVASLPPALKPRYLKALEILKASKGGLVDLTESNKGKAFQILTAPPKSHPH